MVNFFSSFYFLAVKKIGGAPKINWRVGQTGGEGTGGVGQEGMD